MRIRAIINPSAGRQLVQKNADKVIRMLLNEGTIHQVELIETRGSGDAYRAAFDFKPYQVDMVMAVGGDGTVHEVVNGLIDGHHQTPLAIFPAGTVNDFATAMKIPRDPDEYADMIRRFSVRSVDVGKAGDRYFFNVLAGGMLTDVAYKTPPETKTVLGQLAYIISGALDLPAQLFRSIPITIESEGIWIEDDIRLFLVSNTTSVGGFRCLAPQASFEDGLLDVLVVHKQGLFELLPLVVQLMNGDHVTNSKISYFQTRSVRISSRDPAPVALDLDGEQYGALPVTVTAVPDAIRLVVP